jgi:nudix-type nucleoside diphosphatase (YffH/AdpP family)
VTGHQITNVRTLFHAWRKVLELTIRLPNGQDITREITDRGSAVAVLPYDLERRKVILIRQFRAAVLYAGGPEFLLETVAGLLDDDAPEVCARREAMEEAGLRLDILEPVGAGWSAPGATTEQVHMFLAPYRAEDRVAAGGGLAEEHEDIEVIEFGFEDLDAMLAQHAFADLKTLALVQALRLRHPEAFEKA